MSFEANKIAAAVLVAMIVAMVSGILAEKLVHPTMLAKNVYEVAGAPAAGGAAAGGAAAGAAPAQAEPIGPLLASASAEEGARDVAVCKACHTFVKGGPNGVGPNLYGVVGDEIAHDRGNYAFSDALKKAGAGKTWTPDLLNEWLFKPTAFASATKMTFVGMPQAKKRADVIAYLNTMSDNPKPLTSAASAAPSGGGAAPSAPPAAAPAGAPAAGSGGK
jgi:cytochrome c